MTCNDSYVSLIPGMIAMMIVFAGFCATDALNKIDNTAFFPFGSQAWLAKLLLPGPGWGARSMLYAASTPHLQGM
jgi:hypothetical protein